MRLSFPRRILRQSNFVTLRHLQLGSKRGWSFYPRWYGKKHEDNGYIVISGMRQETCRGKRVDDRKWIDLLDVYP